MNYLLLIKNYKILTYILIVEIEIFFQLSKLDVTDYFFDIIICIHQISVKKSGSLYLNVKRRSRNVWMTESVSSFCISQLHRNLLKVTRTVNTMFVMKMSTDWKYSWERWGENNRHPYAWEMYTYTHTYTYYIVCGIIWSLAPDKRFTATLFCLLTLPTVLHRSSNRSLSLTILLFRIARTVPRFMHSPHAWIHNYIILLFISAHSLLTLCLGSTGISMLNPSRVAPIRRTHVTKQFPQSRSNIKIFNKSTIIDITYNISQRFDQGKYMRFLLK